MKVFELIVFKILDSCLFQAQDIQPVIFEEISVKENLSGYVSSSLGFLLIRYSIVMIQSFPILKEIA